MATKDFLYNKYNIINNKSNNILDYNNINTFFIQYAITSTNQKEFLTFTKKRQSDIMTCISTGKVNHILVRKLPDRGADRSDIYLRARMGCNWRGCKYCMENRVNKYRSIFKKAIKSMQSPRFMTVSFKNGTVSPHDANKQFMRFRQYIQRDDPLSITSYICVMEFGKKNHIHYHMIYDGKYLAWKYLKTVFQRVTKNRSWYVFIKKVNGLRSAQGGANYLAKYISKGNVTRKGLRLIKTFRQDLKKGVNYQRFYMIFEDECYILEQMIKYDLYLIDNTISMEENYLLKHYDTYIQKQINEV